MDFSLITELAIYTNDAYEVWAWTEKPGKWSVVGYVYMKPDHADDLQTVAAFGDWHKNVPAGFVGVVAYAGGRLPNGHYPNSPERYFLVLKEEYNQPRPESSSFIVDPSRHQEITKFC